MLVTFDPGWTGKVWCPQSDRWNHSHILNVRFPTLYSDPGHPAPFREPVAKNRPPVKLPLVRFFRFIYPELPPHSPALLYLVSMFTYAGPWLSFHRLDREHLRGQGTRFG